MVFDSLVYGRFSTGQLYRVMNGASKSLLSHTLSVKLSCTLIDQYFDDRVTDTVRVKNVPVRLQQSSIEDV